ncbi:hypothetical protein ABVT39_026003 [Epinephelus coioides]
MFLTFSGIRHSLIMSSDHICLLRRPLPSRRFPPIVKTSPAPTVSAGAAVQSLLLDQGDAGPRGSSRQGADTPAPRAAPPTPLQPKTSTLLTDKITEAFPCKPPRLRPNNPLLSLLHSDQRFLPPPPTFCLSDFLQSHNGAQDSSQSLPV